MKKIGIILLGLLVLPALNASAIDVKVSLEYSSVDRKYTTYDMVDQLSFEWNEKNYVFARIGEDYKSYSLKSDNESVGSVSLIETAIGYEWVIGLGKDSIRVLFNDYNDPRELEIRVNEKYAWYMSNMEPDCNSIFDLYANKAFMEKYDADKIVSSAKAKKACAKTKWTIEWNENKEIPTPVFLAYTFSSSMAMTVRGVYSEY
jgi:hypothetical protein